MQIGKHLQGQASRDPKLRDLSPVVLENRIRKLIENQLKPAVNTNKSRINKVAGIIWEGRMQEEELEK